MRTSLIVTCGYIKHSDVDKEKIENERLFAFIHCIKNLANLDFSKDDEIIIVEYGQESRLEELTKKILSGKKARYAFVKGEGFNQSIAKNAGASLARNEIICWINSDVIVQKNIFDVLHERFMQNSEIFATCARHDIFIPREEITVFCQEINNEANYVYYNTEINDPGWHYALRNPKQPIKTTIKSFFNPFYNQVLHDFQNGYINYGELMAVSKETWKKYRFDEEITALVDSYYRDIIFANEPIFGLALIHDKTAIFHISGIDFMQQEKKDSDKYKRLIEDIKNAAIKYECMRHWLVFSYFLEFDDLIEKLQIPFKEIFETWITDFSKKYYRNKEHVNKKYNVKF